MIGASSNWKSPASPSTPLSGYGAANGGGGKSQRAKMADEMWGDSAGGGGGGQRSSSRNGGGGGPRFFADSPIPPALANNGSSSTSPLNRSAQQQQLRSQQVPAFSAYHNFHSHGGSEAISSVLQGGGTNGSAQHSTAAAASRHERQRALEADFYPLRQRSQANRIMGEIRDPRRAAAAAANSIDMLYASGGGGGGGPNLYGGNNDAGAYTYTGGFASSVFATSSSNEKDLTDDERREIYRQRHREAYAALASVKPFLERIFEDNDTIDRGAEQEMQALALAQQQQQQLQMSGLGGNEVSNIFGGQKQQSSASGLNISGAGNNNGTSPADMISGTPEEQHLQMQLQQQLQQRSKALYKNNRTPNSRSLGGGGMMGSSLTQDRDEHMVYAKQQASTAVNNLPAWSYEELVRRESAKPLLMNTVVTTDRCPLTTKTCPPTYTAFNTFNYTADAKDPEAFSYFAQVASTGSAAATQAKQRARMLGGSSSSAAARMNQPLNFTEDKGAAEAQTVHHGMLQSGTLNPGMRVFRDYLLPDVPPASISGSHGRGTHNQLHDEKALLQEAHLAHLKHVIHSTKRVSERNHLSHCIDYDRW